MFGYVREEPIIHSISDTTRDIILYYIYSCLILPNLLFRNFGTPSLGSLSSKLAVTNWVPYLGAMASHGYGERYGKIWEDQHSIYIGWIMMDQHGSTFQDIPRIGESMGKC